ncbi:uncharacterized protein LOC113211824 [Frankliniella occidentalis]|uniref:Uncharacterized protein LOC113211824 n=1 Tax=Frankliniella occidentalis TaxID=133901 RepID=A0A6J1T3B6_FRAOC|nr:uncharacterized protein LOC113211824 [Frankliniella occidentalis]XP_026286111.1 uncharacterized protein LOC113211824 [Frankliniella occidentalis]
MDNHNFEYSDIPGFHINIPKNNHSVPAAFQDDTEVAESFSEPHFQNSSEHYFQDNATHSQSDQKLDEPSIYDIRMNENNVYENTHCSQDTSDQNRTSYCPEIQNQSLDNAPLLSFSENLQQNPHEETYINSVSPSQGFSSQFLPEQFSNQNVFPDNIQPSGDVNTNAQQPENISADNPSEFLAPKKNDAYFPNASVNPEADASMYSTPNEDLNMTGSYSEPPLETEMEYPEVGITRNTSSGTESSFGCVSPYLPPVDDPIGSFDNGEHSTGTALHEVENSVDYNINNTPVEELNLYHSEAALPQLQNQEDPTVSTSNFVNQESDPESSTNHNREQDVSDNEVLFDSLQSVDVSNTPIRNPEEKDLLCGSDVDTPQISSADVDSSLGCASPLLPPIDDDIEHEVTGTPPQNIGERELHHSTEEKSAAVEETESLEPADIDIGREITATPPQNIGDKDTLHSNEEKAICETVSFGDAVETPPPINNDTGAGVTDAPSLNVGERDPLSSSEEKGNPLAVDETLECITNSLEEGIEASKEKEKNSPSAEKVRALSPMITLLDGDFGEGIETFSSADNNEDSEKKFKTDVEENRIVTRAKTGAIPNKTPRFIEEFGDSDDSSKHSVQMDEWEYEDGAEIAPCKPDPTVTVHQDVLRVTDEELAFYKEMFQSNGIEGVLKLRLHCTSCGRHIGAAPNYIHLGNRHKVLRVLTCNRCRSFYGIGQFTKDSDGSELYCRWCGQGGQVICCSSCPNVFCQPCIRRNFGNVQLNTITALNEWACFLCNYKELWPLRAICWALLSYTMKEKKDALTSNDLRKNERLEEDRSKCCGKKQRKRKHPARTRASGSKVNNNLQVNATVQEVDNPDASASAFDESIDFGDHFLFGGENFENSPDISNVEGHQENASEEDDYLDLSQFVQPILEEKSPSHPRNAPVATSSRPTPQLAPINRNYRPLAPKPIVKPKTKAKTFQPPGTVAQQVMTSAGPRILIRQGNLLQPGLEPINSQPNRINVPVQSATVSRPIFTSNSQGQPQLKSRNPSNFLSNMDGVRSMEQLQSLNQVPWFRDGIDSIRAVGFALNKRIRDLEARFHSLKNKQDVEKVMVLGKKLDRLSKKTDQRFKQITSTIQSQCRSWAYKNGGDPFNSYNEAPSDWDDDMELSKPLEKVMIPVNASALQSSGIRPGLLLRPCAPPPLVRVNSPLPFQGRFPQVSMQPRPRAPGPVFVRGQVLPVRTVFRGGNQHPAPRSRFPLHNPAYRFKQIQSNPRPVVPLVAQNDVLRVGAFINQRNGPNSVSISLTPSKRPRLDSDSDSDSDIVVCPTVPELLKMHNVKPCRVRLEKCDDFIVSFLEKQQQIRSESENTIAVPQSCIIEEEVISSGNPFISEVETTLLVSNINESIENDNIVSLNDTTNSTNQAAKADSDDDIEIISEVTT